MIRSTRTTSRQRPLARVTGLGPPERGDRGTGEHRVRTPTVLRAPRGRERAVERGLGGPDLAEPAERGRLHGMRLRLAGGVPRRDQRLGRRRHRLCRRTQRLRFRQHGPVRKAGVPCPQTVGARGETPELVDRGARGADVAARQQRLAPIQDQIGPRCVSGFQPIDRAAEKARGDRQVVARQRPPARRSEMPRRPRADRAPPGVDRAELAEVLVRLLEVPAERLIVLDGTSALRLEPVGEARVQLGARPLEDAAIGRVADEHVVEAHDGLAQEPACVRLDELAPPKRLQARIEVGDVGGQQMRDGSARELPSDDGGALEDRTLRGPEALDARREQRVDRRRHLERGQLHAGRPAVALASEDPVVHQHADQLADEERVALAGRQHAARDRRRQLFGPDDVGGEPRRRARVEAAERRHRRDEVARAGERRAAVAQLRTRGHQDHEPHAGPPLHEVLDQVEQQGLRPLHVVDHQHDGPHCRGGAQEAAHDEERLLGRRRRAGEERRDAGRDARRLLARQQRLDGRPDLVASRAGGKPQVLAQGVGQRRERPAAGGVAVRAEHRRLRPEPARELREEPRLADTRRAQDRGEARARRTHRALVDGQQAAELLVTADEGGRRGAGRALEREHAEGADRLRPTLQRERPDRLERDQVAHEALGRLADEDVAVARLLLQAGRDVQRVTDARRVLVGDDDLPRVDGDPQAGIPDDLALLSRELAERSLHGDGGADRADGVVLGDERHAERAHDAVAQELDDGAPVRLDRRAHRPVVMVHDPVHRLRVQALVQRRRPDQVGEDDGDGLPHLDGRGPRREGRPARITEHGARTAVGTAARAARRQRGAAAVAEPRTLSVRLPATHAGHGTRGGDNAPGTAVSATPARSCGRRVVQREPHRVHRRVRPLHAVAHVRREQQAVARYERDGIGLALDAQRRPPTQHDDPLVPLLVEPLAVRRPMSARHDALEPRARRAHELLDQLLRQLARDALEEVPGHGRPSLRCTSSAARPSTTTTFRGDVPPAAMRTLALDTPRAAASTRSTAAFALPRSAGSRTATFTASPSQPTTASREAPGVTFTASLTAPW